MVVEVTQIHSPFTIIFTPMLQGTIADIVTHATAKALATHGSAGINVVPVSSVKIVNETIRLIDYFMNKTSKNMQENPDVALVCRIDMIGYQIKAQAEYLQSGEDYDQACRWIAPLHPERKIKGLIVLHPTEVHDIAPTKNSEEVRLQQKQKEHV